MLQVSEYTSPKLGTYHGVAMALVKKYTKAKLKSAIIYKGKSRIDPSQNVTVSITGIQGNSKNKKTGNLAQVSIMLSDIHPYEAIKTGADSAICGNCIFRGEWDVTLKKMVNRKCYVNLSHSPNATYKATDKGSYIELTIEEVGALIQYFNSTRSHKDKIGIRLGEYGDPSAVDVSVWKRLLSASNTFNTAYTHQWNRSFFQPEFFEFGMASIDDSLTVEMLRELHGSKPRAYRVAKDYETIKSDEIKCPSEKGKVVTCSQCKLCSGYGRKGAKNIVIVEND